MVLLITQNIHVKIPKYPKRQSFFFIFFEAKSVILIYMKIRKTWNILCSSLSFYNIAGKEVFLLLRILWKAKKAFS